MIKKLLVLSFILGGFGSISAMQERAKMVKEYVAGKMVSDANEQLAKAIREGDTETVYDLYRKQTIDICQAIQVAHEAKQLDILKLLADWCCCKSKILSISEPPAGAVALVLSNFAATAKQHSGFLPPSGASVYTINPDGSIEAKSGFDNRTGPLLQALDNADSAAVKKFIGGGGGFPANAVLVISTPLGNKVQTIGQYALRLRNVDVIDSLLKAGVDINNGSGSGAGTLLHTAVANLDPEMVKFLIGAGANVNAIDASGTTPLHVVASVAGSPGAAEIAQELINAGAKTDVKNSEGNTPAALIQVNENTQAVADIVGKSEKVAEVEAEEPEEEVLSVEEMMKQGAPLEIYVTPSRSQRLSPGQLSVPQQPLAIPSGY